MTRALRVSGTAFSETVLDYAALRGWRRHHTRPARTSKGWRTPIQGDDGFVDLVFARSGRVVFAEMKSPGEKLSDGQRAWQAELPSVPGVAERYVWQAKDWPQIQEVLR